MTTSAIQRMIDELVTECVAKRSLPDDTSAHTLRHTFATHY
jgi:site-specific recombinase XerD